ncbi:MAG: DUF2442 domain-containing protein [Phormidesmis sp. RL_2_1]|nr:DUF2442 domain-containing protein [Phormidesmis sp. RL_2_1]
MSESMNTEITSAEIARLSARSQERAQIEHRAQKARYDSLTRCLLIKTRKGEDFRVNVDLLQGVASADDSQIANLEILPGGEGIHWPALDASLLVHGLCTGMYGSKRWMESLSVKQAG